MIKPLAFKGVYLPEGKYNLFERDGWNWQAQWYDPDSLNDDKYEKGGYYATEAEAIKAARRGKAYQDFFTRLADESRQPEKTE